MSATIRFDASTSGLREANDLDAKVSQELARHAACRNAGGGLAGR
jgi:hypothetical protein